MTTGLASAEPLLRVEQLRKHYPFTKGMLLAKTLGQVKAVDDISFTSGPARRWAWSASSAAARPRRRS